LSLQGGRERGREGGRDGGVEGGTEGGMEGGTEGGMEVASLELIAEQLALADRVLLNKMDLLEGEGGRKGGREGGRGGLRGYVREMAPGAVLLECVKGEVEIDQLLGLEAFSLAKTRVREEEKGRVEEEGGGHHHHHEKEEEGVEGKEGGMEGGREGGREGHVHARLGFTSVGIEIGDGPLEWTKFEEWLGKLLTKTTQTVVAAPPAADPSSLPPSSAAATTADDSSSLPPSSAEEQQQQQQQQEQQQQQQQEQVIVRMKGILWVTKKTPYRRATIIQKRVILQGIYGHLEMDEQDLPPSLPSSLPSSKLVLIGRFKDAKALKEEMEKELLECLAPGWYAKRRE